MWWFNRFQTVGEGAAYGLCPKSRARRAPCLPKFILLGSFSDTLFVVSILDISVMPVVAAFAVLRGLLMVPVGTMDPF